VAVKNGYVWGRGALDMKGEAITQLMTMLILKRAPYSPEARHHLHRHSGRGDRRRRGGCLDVEHQADLFRNAEFLLNEGGLTRADGAGESSSTVWDDREIAFWLEVTARGRPARLTPDADNPVHRLIAALNRLAEWRTPSP